MTVLLSAFLLLIGVGILVAANNWRAGLMCAYIVALVQDPVRKATEGRSPYFILAFLPVYAAILLSLYRSQPDFWRLAREYPGLKRVFILALLVVGLGAITTLVTYGLSTLPLVVLGVLGYLGAVPGVVVGYFTPHGPEHLRRILAIAGILSAVALVGAIFEYQGYKWDVLGTLDRRDWWHHYGLGKYVRMLSGFFRAPEVMGWHGALVAMVGLTLFATSRGGVLSSAWLVMAGWGVTGCLLSGRRKMLVMVVIFLAVVVVRFFQKRRMGLGVVLAVGAGCALFGMQFFLEEGPEGYLDLSTTTMREMPERLETTSYGFIWQTLQEAGVLGYGLGTMSQGAQYFAIERPRIWQEGGLSKVLVELGIPGLLVFFYAAVVLLLACVKAIRVGASLPGMSVLMTCLVGILAANAACFVAGQQLFGDPFILFLNGLVVGFLLSSVRLVRLRQHEWHRQRQQKQQRTLAGAVP